MFLHSYGRNVEASGNIVVETKCRGFACFKATTATLLFAGPLFLSEVHQIWGEFVYLNHKCFTYNLLHSYGIVFRS